MKRQQATIGAVIAIKLPCEKFGYGRILHNSSYAFYNLITDDQITDLAHITSQSILFIITVDAYPVRSGRWVKLGNLAVEPELQKLPMNFMQDITDPNHLSLYDPNTGDITERASFEQCIGLERTASWEAEHVESRICDHFAGVPNDWVEQLKLKYPTGKSIN